MMFPNPLVFAAFLVGTVFTAPHPHVGMVDNEVARDVGAVFTQPHFQSPATFLLLNKASPQCMPLAAVKVMSVQVCVEAVKCDFYKGMGCGIGSGEKPVFTVGCGDVAEVPPSLVAVYKSYKCQLALNHAIDGQATVELPTTPHDPDQDVVSGMQRMPSSVSAESNFPWSP
ncbi:hypothetical protein PTNB73_08191 [Pyrenophora teres f. teres]|nr:hypothetical protein HRS9139_08305 [Pyrenophora teres f. teres]KAE8834287.1 hypothetical protein PTNB85_05620 [Pyrenophora teres f. teres]KAE8844228.1 hypothetical protein HRS9122_05331 [Pyrenophora teres f. teres]KAE8858711.1 hypothetical protein PTNB73_08191 [Pyrenophora teres f. teres]KAE8860576.1 hypothetical protein PTNB29_05671 [Pyrenophora teres f. teres]